MPDFSFALNMCGNPGATVIFVNGIFGNLVGAIEDKDKLAEKFLGYAGDKNTKFINGFNPSHASGMGDLIKSVAQSYEINGLDYDLTTILNQVHEDLKTRKVLLVGHSQGTFYTNAAYEYLIKNGVPAKSIGVYNVATPDEYVAGGGNYLTSSTDKVINEVVRNLSVVGLSNRPLPANIDIKLSEAEQNSTTGGHSFSDVYLASASDRIIGEINQALNKLEGDEKSENKSYGCFVKPGESLLYKVSGVELKIADTVGGAFSNFSSSTNTALAKLGSWGKSFLASLFNKNNSTEAAVLEESNTSSDVSFLNEEQQKQVKEVKKDIENVFSGIGISDPNTVAESLDDILDDIAEKLDIIAQQIREMQRQQDPVQPLDENQDEDTKEDSTTNNEKTDDSDEELPTYTNNGGSGGSSVFYSQILISEVQAASASDEKSEFIELYNPNDKAVDLTGWYLQRKTKEGKSYSSYAANTLFSGQQIPAKGYFLIARTGYFSGANIFVESPITKDNSFVIKNPNGEISDMLGFGEAQDFEVSPAVNPVNGQSIGRKVFDGVEQDTDNNLADFELQKPTPRRENETWSEENEPKEDEFKKDSSAPVAKFSLDSVQKESIFNINFIVEDIDGVTSASGIGSYVFRWKAGENGDWQQDSSVNVGGDLVVRGVRNFTGEDGKTYYFQIKSKDLAKNESDWQPETPAETKVEIPKTILINEIQDSGIKDEKEDFIELYNPNDVDVDLTGWYLQRKTATGETYNSYVTNTLFKEKTIKSKKYFLIARTGYFTDLADISLDEPITENNSLVLKRKDGSVSDKLGWGDATDFETAAAVSPKAGESIERKKIGLDTNNNSADFRISEKPSPKESFITANIKDDTNYQDNFNLDNDTYFYNLNISWGSSILNVDYFDVQYKLNDGSWKDWMMGTKETAGSFKAFYSLIDEANVYSFRVKVADLDGNISDWKEIDVDLSAPVVINEIAFHGTVNDKNDKWIELYNRSSNTINLDGWQIVSGSSKITLSGSIPGNGYFILEKDDDTVLSDIVANQTFTESFPGNFIHLLNTKGQRVDEIYNDGNWNNYEQGSYSFERISPWAYGFIKENWKLNDGKIINGNDATGSPIYGTPASKNTYYQLYTFLPLAFGRDEFLPNSLSPYVFGENTRVLKDITLEIEPGSVLKASNSSSLLVDGTIKSIGTESQKIIFTSISDDELGDTNNNGLDSELVSGLWLGIELGKTSQNSKFDHTVFRYAGASLSKMGAAIKVNQSSVSILNSIFESIKNRGIFSINSSTTVESSQFYNITEADSWTAHKASAIHISGGKAEINDCHFEFNNYGIQIDDYIDENGTRFDSNVSIKGNEFLKNAKPVYLWTINNISFSNNTASENTYDNIIIFGEAMESSATLDLDLPYFLDGVLAVPENTVLTLTPGVIMNLPGMTINGTLKSVGTEDNPIIFRNYYWDQEDAGPGKWFGLSFTKTSTESLIENVEIFYAGNFYYGGPAFGAAIKADNCNISLKDSYLHDNQNNGLWLINSNSVIDNVKFYNHTAREEFIGQAKAIFIQGGSPEVKNSYFEKQTFGIYLDKYIDSDGKEILQKAILHREADDSEKNIFVDTTTIAGDIVDVSF